MKRGWDLTDAELDILAFIGDRSLAALEIRRGLKLDPHAADARLTHLANTGMLSCREETGGDHEWRYVLTWRAWEELERRGKREKRSVLQWIRLFLGAGRRRSRGESNHSVEKKG